MTTRTSWDAANAAHVERSAAPCGEPLTPAQLGAIRGEFARLGYRDPYDRGARLAASARLLALDGLDSTKALTMGQAGCLYRQLCGFASRADLAAAVTVPTFRDSLRPVLVAVLKADMRQRGQLGNLIYARSVKRPSRA